MAVIAGGDVVSHFGNILRGDVDGRYCRDMLHHEMVTFQGGGINCRH